MGFTRFFRGPFHWPGTLDDGPPRGAAEILAFTRRAHGIGLDDEREFLCDIEGRLFARRDDEDFVLVPKPDDSGERRAMMLTAYTLLGRTCVCQTWDRGSPWHANAVNGHHAGCFLLNFDPESQRRVEGMTAHQLAEAMARAPAH